MFQTKLTYFISSGSLFQSLRVKLDVMKLGCSEVDERRVIIFSELVRFRQNFIRRECSTACQNLNFNRICNHQHVHLFDFYFELYEFCDRRVILQYFAVFYFPSNVLLWSWNMPGCLHQEFYQSLEENPPSWYFSVHGTYCVCVHELNYLYMLSHVYTNMSFAITLVTGCASCFLNEYIKHLFIDTVYLYQHINKKNKKKVNDHPMRMMMIVKL